MISVTGARADGKPSTTLDPNLKNAYMDQVLAYLEREVAPNFSVRTGFVWNHRGLSRSRININQPFGAFNVPVTVTDPGPDGTLGTADDGGKLQAFDLDPAYLSLPQVLQVVNLNQKSNDYTWETTATRRQSGRWSLRASFAETWSRSQPAPITPNALVGTVNGFNKTKTYQTKLVATLDLRWGIRLMPVFRSQSGQAYASIICPATGIQLRRDSTGRAGGMPSRAADQRV